MILFLQRSGSKKEKRTFQEEQNPEKKGTTRNNVNREEGREKTCTRRIAPDRLRGKVGGLFLIDGRTENLKSIVTLTCSQSRWGLPYACPPRAAGVGCHHRRISRHGRPLWKSASSRIAVGDSSKLILEKTSGNLEPSGSAVWNF